MTINQQLKRIVLEKQATALLRGEGLAPAGPIGLIGKLKRREADSNLVKRNRRETVVELRFLYQQLSKAARKTLASRFKQQRIGDPTLDWNDWLARTLR
ncbi:hypothetical protein NLM33_35110 [Bradyrhizobium sp. CCGUVB1N3]|uniref:hypothetical protein n=1 Tax=Bradyrhizobium sp. CCGUVB1N3 TaxID=2949629 RepID=UPI0020B44686|nr:hypothetical protein [Bradyrhizobium sp. CCGUVB1N3]MCP3475523.1 hypothetical protein [Bradyrhizobium sp. CCGUVB1N3]